jgi:hypothetical protein
MGILLSESDVRLLKELKAAGEHGRLISKGAPRDGLSRLVRVFYVSERAVSPNAVRYLITAAGRDALDTMATENG